MNLKSWFSDLSSIVDAKSNKLAGFAPKIYTKGRRVFEDQPGDPDQWAHARTVTMRSIEGIEKHNKTLKTVAALTTAAMFGSFGLLYIETQKNHTEVKWAPYNEAGQMVNAIIPSSPAPPDVVEDGWIKRWVLQMARKSSDDTVRLNDNSRIAAELCGGEAISSYNAFVSKRPATTMRTMDALRVFPTVNPHVYRAEWREQGWVENRAQPIRDMQGEFKVHYDSNLWNMNNMSMGFCVSAFSAGQAGEVVR